MTIETAGPGVVTLAPEDRAAALAETKAVLRVAGTDEDALLAAFVEAALGLAEQFTGRVLLARTMQDIVPARPAWRRLAAAPVRAITAVAAVDGAVLASAAYAIDIDAAGDGWVRTIDAGGATLVAVTLTAGRAESWAAIPAPLRRGVVLLAAHLFTARDTANAPPAAVTALWRPFRTVALARAARAC